MRRMMMCMVASVVLVAEAAPYSKMAVDVSSLPVDKAFFRRVVLSRVWSRTPSSDVANTLTVRLSFDASIPGETAVVKVSNGVAEIRGGRFRFFVNEFIQFFRIEKYFGKLEPQ